MQNSQVNVSSRTVSMNAPTFAKLVIMQVLVGIFLYVNCLMIFTFLKKEVFRGDTRYILFAQTLFVDSAVMLITDVLMIWGFYLLRIHMTYCVITCVVVAVLKSCTPVTLVAMCLERYVAICMPLRHAGITSSTRIRFFGFLIIWNISCLFTLLTFIAFTAETSPEFMSSYVICNMEILLVKEWQYNARGGILLIFFLMMISVMVFTYIKIMIAARAASSEKKKSTSKGLRTVLLHAVQMLLCMVQLLTPYIELPFWKVNIMVFNNIRYSNLIIFIIVPRCLSPLIYGLRDEKFFAVLRHYAVCGLIGFSQVQPVKRKS
ncbi:odorant receptor 131-2-like [Astyanax mexicanus]|uniref:odorant receptor 131-2-like n=1 Tax=Astyanax mexicanus TaxID=7994 RepID=UPI0020CB45EA|nr:odorant receptor 131-2-like [Astyanax mexicanus]